MATPCGMMRRLLGDAEPVPDPSRQPARIEAASALSPEGEEVDFWVAAVFDKKCRKLVQRTKLPCEASRRRSARSSRRRGTKGLSGSGAEGLAALEACLHPYRPTSALPLRPG